MSVDAAKEFLGNLKLAEQIKQVKDDKEKVQQLIKEAGYDFTEEELKSAKSELSDEDLDLVAGGRHSYHHTLTDLNAGIG